MNRRIPLPIGISDFSELREGKYYFADKSLFIRDIITAWAKAILLPRPRRFGKTLNLSMLRYFFEKTDTDRTELFDGLNIRNDEVFATHQGRYPVIYLTFKDAKALCWKNMYQTLTLIIRDEFLRHEEMLKAVVLTPAEKAYLESVLMLKASQADYETSLRFLSRHLAHRYQEKVVILIDEYDTPLHAGYAEGYYEETISFMRNFLSAGLKDNENLFRGVLTGILRVAKESVFSGLNNLGVYTLLNRKFSDFFGFTEHEVRDILEFFDMSEHYDKVSYWYNGYLFGDTVIYNPWSVLNYMDNDGDAKPYWVNTAGTEIIDRLATRGGKELREEIGQLLEGKTIVKPVYDSIVMRDLEQRDELLWSFLLFSGYLKTVEKTDDETFRLRIPNQEVKMIYRELVRTWFAEKIRDNQLEEMLNALDTGDIRLFERMLRQIVIRIMSYHDLGSEPEKVYHALVLGMLVWMSGKYEIRSNRESGYGRYDLMLKPRDISRHGIIIEFKKVDESDNETPEQALDRALVQIEERQYAIELETAGIRKIFKIAIVFQGKQLWIRHITEKK